MRETVHQKMAGVIDTIMKDISPKAEVHVEETGKYGVPDNVVMEDSVNQHPIYM